MKKAMQALFDDWLDGAGKGFSGVLSASDSQGVLAQKARGERNRAESLPNRADTAFGIAAGTKMFTGLAVCKLMDEKKLSLHDKLCDLVSFDLGEIDRRVTVFHLLTHTSGIGDYIDEDAEDCEAQLQALYDTYPVQLWTRLSYYLQMIAPLPPKFAPGERYCYSNAGFVLLGLVIEAASGLPYQQFVQEQIIAPCGLTHTGFYRADALPHNAAHGYMLDENTAEWRTNIYSLPIMGGSDGGLFTCAADLDTLWRAVFANRILSAEMTAAFLKPQVIRDEESGKGYGLGVYTVQRDNQTAYYAVGGDFGVDFFTAYFPQSGIAVSALGNTNVNTYPLLHKTLALLACSGFEEA